MGWRNVARPGAHVGALWEDNQPRVLASKWGVNVGKGRVHFGPDKGSFGLYCDFCLILGS